MTRALAIKITFGSLSLFLIAMLANDALSYPFYNGDFYIFIENGGLKAITAVATIFGVYSWVTSPKT